MIRAIAAVAVLVPDLDQALAFFVGTLGFRLVEDTPLAKGGRWVRVAPTAAPAPCLRLAEARNDDERRAVGNQAGGRVFLFLETDDLEREHRRLAAAGVVFTELPRSEAYGRVAVFVDPFGNRWDLIEPADRGDPQTGRT